GGGSARGGVAAPRRAGGRSDRPRQVHTQLRSDSGTHSCIIHLIAPPSHLGRRLALPGITAAPGREFTHCRGLASRPGRAWIPCVDATAPAVVAAIPDLNTDSTAG